MAYTKTTWATGDVITAEKLNNAEDGIAANDTALAGKQATLVSGTNIKTINNTSLLGSGNIAISGGSSGTMLVTYDPVTDQINKSYGELTAAMAAGIIPVMDIAGLLWFCVGWDDGAINPTEYQNVVLFISCTYLAEYSIDCWLFGSNDNASNMQRTVVE